MELVIGFLLVMVVTAGLTALIILKSLKIVLKAFKPMDDVEVEKTKRTIHKQNFKAYDEVKEEVPIEELKKLQNMEFERLKSWVGDPDYLKAYAEESEE